MFDHLLRALKDRLLQPIARAIGPGVGPNWISALALACGIAAAVAAADRRAGVALALWIANRILDGLDGAAARVHGTQSDFGGYLDILLDFIVYAAIPIGLVLGWPSRGVAIAALVLMAAYFVNAASWMYLAAILEKRAVGATARGELTTVTMPPGIIAGTETVIFFTLFLISPTHLQSLFSIMAALVCVNVLQRLVWAQKYL